MYSRLVLLLPGTVNYAKLSHFLHKDDYIIAVDGGIEHSSSLNIEPHLWVGDFDSCRAESKTEYSHIPIEAFPTDKDFLDTELALTKAQALNIHECVMIGGMGGRLDHQLSLFMLLTHHTELKFLHTNGETEMYSLNHKTERTINAENFNYVSIIPITQLEDVSIVNVKWPLHNVILPPGKGFSVSNTPTEKFIHYTQNKGLGWLVLTN